MIEVEERECKPRHKELTGDPWNVEVDVYLTKACPNPKFEIYTTLPVGPDGIIFKNNHRPGFYINFNLYDETGGGYVFPPESMIMDACWSQVGTSCPHAPIWEVLEPLRVTNHQKTLVVYNANPPPGLGAFTYTLRVTNDDCASYCPLDPGGYDGNGSSLRD